MFKFINKLKNRKGFTLIELLVVLAVLAIIGLIAVPNFMQIKEKARVKADDATVETIRRSIQIAVEAEDITITKNTVLFKFSNSGIEYGDDNASGAKMSLDTLSEYIDTSVNAQSSSTNVVFSVDDNGKVSYK